MRHSFLKLTVAAIALVGAMAVPAAAQDTKVGANLTFLRDSEQTGPGFQVDLARGFNPNVAVVGEFGLNNFDGFTIQSYQAGLRFTPTMSGALRPFVQALVGLERCCEQNALAFQIGGGIEYPITDRVNFRAQYDFRRTDYDGEGFNANRFGVGIVLPLGN